MELFVSDLDGTLLNADQEISTCSVTTINSLLADGLQFSIATARGFESTTKIIAPLNLTLPIILSNGAFVYDPVHKINLLENMLEQQAAAAMLEWLENQRLDFFLFTFDKNGEQHIYYKELQNTKAREYYDDRIQQGDARFRDVADFKPHLTEKIVKFIVIGNEDLQSVYEELKDKYELNFDFTQDIYSKAYWLEIAHRSANKRDALRFLKNYVKAERLTCFGDNLNDCPMFEIADVSVAMGNAHPKLKAMSSKIIGSNHENGVAEYLHNLYIQAKLNIVCTIEK